MELRTVNIFDIVPYENNPRRNDEAVAAVKESITQCTYIAPVIVDENMVVLAGHTRLRALQELGESECRVLVAEGLTEEQKRKYRLLDNKTNEFAEWDFERLDIELADLDFGVFDFGFGENLEITSSNSHLKDQKEPDLNDDDVKMVECPNCGFHFETL